MMKGVGKGLCGAFLKPPAGMLRHFPHSTTSITNMLQASGDLPAILLLEFVAIYWTLWERDRKAKLWRPGSPKDTKRCGSRPLKTERR